MAKKRYEYAVTLLLERLELEPSPYGKRNTMRLAAKEEISSHYYGARKTRREAERLYDRLDRIAEKVDSTARESSELL